MNLAEKWAVNYMRDLPCAYPMPLSNNSGLLIGKSLQDVFL